MQHTASMHLTPIHHVKPTLHFPQKNNVTCWRVLPSSYKLGTYAWGNCTKWASTFIISTPCCYVMLLAVVIFSLSAQCWDRYSQDLAPGNSFEKFVKYVTTSSCHISSKISFEWVVVVVGSAMVSKKVWKIIFPTFCKLNRRDAWALRVLVQPTNYSCECNLNHELWRLIVSR